MRRAFLILLTIVLGLLIGALSALAKAGLMPGADVFRNMDVNIAAWRSDWAIGSPTANPYLRARVARHGLLGLTKSEAVYFTRSTDDAGRKLNARCSYILSGTDQAAQWWSITLYDGDSRLPMNTDNALSIDATMAAQAYGGETQSWQAHIAIQRPADARMWISSQAAGFFDLTLRLYRPSSALLEAPGDHLRPPSVQKQSCREAAS